jgi:hypothetical protein
LQGCRKIIVNGEVTVEGPWATPGVASQSPVKGPENCIASGLGPRGLPRAPALRGADMPDRNAFRALVVALFLIWSSAGWTALANAQQVGRPIGASASGREPLSAGTSFSLTDRGQEPERQEGEREPAELEESEKEDEELETDRDSFTPATTTVKLGGVLVESAYSFIDNKNVAETHSYPEFLIRYGWRENVELRLGWNYEIGGAGNPVSGNISDFEEEGSESLEQEAKLLYGAKFFLTEQRGWTPRSSFILQGFTPTFGESNLTTLSATQVCGWTLRNGWVWDNALRYGTSGFEGDHFNVWSPSTVLKIPLTERVKTHVEYFGAMTEGRERETTQHFFSPGAHYLLTRNFEIGMRVGWGLNEQAPNFFANAGIGWLF